MIAFTPHQYTFLIKCSLGLGQQHHGEGGSTANMQRGISISETFYRGPLKTKAEFQKKVASLAKELAKRMEREELGGLVVCLKLKMTDFYSRCKQEKQNKYVWTYEELKSICFRILDQHLWPCPPIRLVRIRVSSCKNTHAIKVDRSMEEFTTKLGDEEWRQQNTVELAQVGSRVRHEKALSLQVSKQTKRRMTLSKSLLPRREQPDAGR